jgi:hypothetical protein
MRERAFVRNTLDDLLQTSTTVYFVKVCRDTSSLQSAMVIGTDKCSLLDTTRQLRNGVADMHMAGINQAYLPQVGPCPADSHELPGCCASSREAVLHSSSHVMMGTIGSKICASDASLVDHKQESPW